MSQNPITPAGQVATPVAVDSAFPERRLSPGIVLERRWLLEDHTAAEQELHRVQVETDPDDPRREEAARKLRKAADRVAMHKADCSSALYMMFKSAIDIGSDRGLCDLLKQLPMFAELEAENKRLRRHLRETREALANEIAKRGEGVFA